MSTTNQTNTGTDQLLVGVKTVSAMLGRCERSIWRDCQVGRMPGPYSIGGAKKWNLRELKRWVSRGCKPCKTSQPSAGAVEPEVVFEVQQAQVPANAEQGGGRVPQPVPAPDATAVPRKRSTEDFRRDLRAEWHASQSR